MLSSQKTIRFFYINIQYITLTFIFIFIFKQTHITLTFIFIYIFTHFFIFLHIFIFFSFLVYGLFRFYRTDYIGIIVIINQDNPRYTITLTIKSITQSPYTHHLLDNIKKYFNFPCNFDSRYEEKKLVLSIY